MISLIIEHWRVDDMLAPHYCAIGLRPSAWLPGSALPQPLDKVRFTVHGSEGKGLALIIIKLTKAASHRRVAFFSIASNTGTRSPGDELITCRTSAVAVCCSRASRLGDKARFPAMTACAASSARAPTYQRTAALPGGRH